MGAKFDISNAISGLDKLKGPLKESLARRMGAGGGRVIRDEARTRAPVYTGPEPRNGGSWGRGVLQRATYVAYNKRASGPTQSVYSISWNSKEAFWGKFVEFGWTQKYRIFYDAAGDYFWTDTTQPLETPKRHPARPFLRPAFDATYRLAIERAIEVGRIEFPKLLSGS